MSMPNSEYWKQRFAQLENAQHDFGESAKQEISKMYDRAQAEIEAQIDKWYRKLAQNNSISMAEAQKWLKGKQLKEFKWDVGDYIEYGKENAMNKMWMKELENASAKFHISKLESLNISLEQSLQKLFTGVEDVTANTLSDCYKEGYYRTMYEFQKGFNVGFDVARINDPYIAKVLYKPWAEDGYNFSENIWKYKTKLINVVHNEITNNLLTGADPQKAIDVIAKKMSNSKFNAGRLVMTEEAYFSSLATGDCFNDLDVGKYEILATLDDRTSEKCISLDGKIFDMKYYQAGVTAPPFHCFCRSTTVPAFDNEYDITGSRAARDSDGKTYYVPGDMRYSEWKAKYVDKTEPMPKSAENNAKTVDKSGKSDIIKSKDTNTQNNLLGKKESLWSKIKSKLASSDNAKIAETDAEAALLDIGFKRVEKSFYSKVDPDMQVRVIDQLTKLEDKFGVIKKSIDPFVTANASGGSVAFTRCTLDTPARQSLHFSKTKYKNAKTHIRDMKRDIASGYCMPCDTDDDTISKYVVTHEYGHMLSNVLAHERMQGTIYTHRSLIESYKTQITDIAKTLDENYSEDKYLSQYGKTNDNEFFAECFANSQLGSPNVLGKAMNIWLERRGF